MSYISDEYRQAERDMAIPPVTERGRRNQNPPELGFWALVAEDFRTHERKIFEQGFWAVFTNRFGNWRMGQPKIVRAPATLLYRIMFRTVEYFGGISLWYTVKLGRRVRLWHHGGMIIGARAIGDDVQIRQNTTIGVGQTGENDQLPIIAAGADIGAGACIAGAIHVGKDTKIGGNALVITDVPDGATAMGNPAQIYFPQARAEAPAAAEASPPEPAPPPAASTAAAAELAVPMVSKPVSLGTVALLGSANLDYLAMNFTETAQELGLEVDLHVPEFGQTRMELLKPAEDSALKRAMQDNAAGTFVVERAEDVLGSALTSPLSLSAEDAEAYLREALQPLLQTVTDAHDKLRGPVFVLSLAGISRSPLALADGGQARGRAALITRANAILAEETAKLDRVRILDTAEMLSTVGSDAARPGEFWHMGRIPFSDVFGRHLARRGLGAILAEQGKTARLLVLDLDNTLWGGVLGEDGIEGVEIGGAYPGSAYREFQVALQALSQRGIALAVASKNDEDLALRMMTEHPEMVLRPADLVAHRIDWSEKALNIQDILDELELGVGSCMFIDDNPVERAKVRKNLPACIVPEFPEAPEDLANWLLENPFLECLDLTESDLKRTQQYKARSDIRQSQRKFENVEDFYRDLEMKLIFEPFGDTNRKRVLQLFVKTNQFNATTRRHDSDAVNHLLSTGGEIYAIGVQDRHSPYELMGVIALRPGAEMAVLGDPAVAAALAADPAAAEALWVDSFLLSCRILGRTVENAILTWAAQRAASREAPALYGQVIQTERNTPVRGVFTATGFERMEIDHETGAGGIFRLDLRAGEAPKIPDYFEVLSAPTPEAPPSRPVPAPQPADAKTMVTQIKQRPRPGKAATAPAAAVAPALEPATEAALARTFRKVFRLEEGSDISDADMSSVSGWDSLTHLKLAMEIERALRIRLSGEDLSRISSYRDLQAVVGQRTSGIRASA